MHVKILLTFLCLMSALAHADVMDSSNIPGTSTGITFNPNIVNNPNAPPVKVNTNSQPIGVITNDDASITISLQQMIAQDPSMAGATIRVICQQGIVTLSGNAKTMAQVTQAANTAQSFPGVKGVSNKITVTSSGFQTGY